MHAEREYVAQSRDRRHEEVLAATRDDKVEGEGNRLVLLLHVRVRVRASDRALVVPVLTNNRVESNRHLLLRGEIRRVGPF